MTGEAIRAVLIDPGEAAFTVRWVYIPTLPPSPGKYGAHLAPDPLVALIGKRVAQHGLPAGEAVLVGEGDGPAWWIADQGPFRGRGILCAYERIADAYADSGFADLEQVAALLMLDEEDIEEEVAACTP